MNERFRPQKTDGRATANSEREREFTFAKNEDNFLHHLATNVKRQIFSERELKFTFTICCRPSVCLSSVTFVSPTQAVQIFGNISTALGTLALAIH